MEQTDNGVDFSMLVTGPQGGRFILHPVRGQHKDEDIEVAKRYLYAQHDVVGRIAIEWNSGRVSKLKLQSLEFRDCEVCGGCIHIINTTSCDHPKNAYCALFQLQAEIDMQKAGMHPSIHTKAKEAQDDKERNIQP